MIEGENTDSLLESYQALQNEEIVIQEEIEWIPETTVEFLKPTTDVIYARLSAGASFEQLAQEYSQLEDGRAYFHPDSVLWTPAFYDTAAALQEAGAISEPVLTSMGLHIIQHVGDLTGGIHQLDENEQATLYATALRQKQITKMQELAEKWKSAYLIEIHEELLR